MNITSFPTVSVIIPAHNAGNCLPMLIDSLLNQSRKADEILVVDDHSTDSTTDVARRYGILLLQNNTNKGPAAARNLGIKASINEILAFIDADCIADQDWIKNILEEFKDSREKVIVGKINIPKSTFLGDSISALGFPAGGHMGLDKMWRVDNEGRTNHITTANFALRKKTMLKIGLFDETFPYGCEDVEFSIRCRRENIPIYYKKNMIYIHAPRKEFRSFIKWHIVRGRSNYYLKKKIKRVRNFIWLRGWSSMNICRKYVLDVKFPLIIFLLLLSCVLQQVGYLSESAKNKMRTS